MKRIKLSEVGKIYQVTKNGIEFTATISNDPSNFPYYSTLGLDVFEDIDVYIETVNVRPSKRKRK